MVKRADDADIAELRTPLDDVKVGMERLDPAGALAAIEELERRIPPDTARAQEIAVLFDAYRIEHWFAAEMGPLRRSWESVSYDLEDLATREGDEDDRALPFPPEFRRFVLAQRAALDRKPEQAWAFLSTLMIGVRERETIAQLRRAPVWQFNHQQHARLLIDSAAEGVGVVREKPKFVSHEAIEQVYREMKPMMDELSGHHEASGLSIRRYQTRLTYAAADRGDLQATQKHATSALAVRIRDCVIAQLDHHFLLAEREAAKRNFMDARRHYWEGKAMLEACGMTRRLENLQRKEERILRRYSSWGTSRRTVQTPPTLSYRAQIRGGVALSPQQ